MGEREFIAAAIMGSRKIRMLIKKHQVSRLYQIFSMVDTKAVEMALMDINTARRIMADGVYAGERYELDITLMDKFDEEQHRLLARFLEEACEGYTHIQD